MRLFLPAFFVTVSQCECALSCALRDKVRQLSATAAATKMMMPMVMTKKKNNNKEWKTRITQNETQKQSARSARGYHSTSPESPADTRISGAARNPTHTSFKRIARRPAGNLTPTRAQAIASASARARGSAGLLCCLLLFSA